MGAQFASFLASRVHHDLINCDLSGDVGGDVTAKNDDAMVTSRPSFAVVLTSYVMEVLQGAAAYVTMDGGAGSGHTQTQKRTPTHTHTHTHTQMRRTRKYPHASTQTHTHTQVGVAVGVEAVGAAWSQPRATVMAVGVGGGGGASSTFGTEGQFEPATC